MKKLSKLFFVIGGLLVTISLISGFLGRNIWVLATDVSLIFVGVAAAINGLFFWHSKDTPSGHNFAWLGLGTGMLLLSIGTLFRLSMAGSRGVSTQVFTSTDYLIVASYALLTAGCYFFMSRAGNVMDEIEKVKIVWGIGVFFILVFDLYIAIQATEIFGKTTAGLLVNIYYVSLDLIMVLIGITYNFAFKDGKVSKFFKLVFLGIFVWAFTDIIFVLRGSYTENVSFFLTWLKILAIYLLVFAQKFYADLFTP